MLNFLLLFKTHFIDVYQHLGLNLDGVFEEKRLEVRIFHHWLTKRDLISTSYLACRALTI